LRTVPSGAICPPMKTFLILALGLVSATSAFAAVSAKERVELTSRSATYFLTAGNAAETAAPAECGPAPSTQACITFVAGAYPSSDERIAAARACVGNYGDTCATWAAGAYPSYDVRVVAARACRNNLSTDCAAFVAGAYPSYDQRIAGVSACQNADFDCVKYVAGAYPSYDQRIAAAKSCAGND
jgi:hypothetical protein